MSQTYYFSGLTSDLTGGADFNRKLVSAVESASSVTVTVAFGSTEDSFAFTEPGVPGVNGATGNYTTVVKVSANNATGPSMAIAWARVNSSGIQQAISSFTTAQAVTTSTQTLTFSATGVNLGAWAAGDRLKVVYRFINSSGGSRMFTLETGTANAAVTTPFSLSYVLTLASAAFALTFPSVSFPINHRLAMTSTAFSISWPDVLLFQGAKIPYPEGGVPYVCERCGFEYPLSQLRKEWTGLWVCRKDYDPKPAQLTAPVIKAEGVPRIPSRYPDPNTGPNLTRPEDL